METVKRGNDKVGEKRAKGADPKPQPSQGQMGTPRPGGRRCALHLSPGSVCNLGKGHGQGPRGGGQAALGIGLAGRQMLGNCFRGRSMYCF